MKRRQAVLRSCLFVGVAVAAILALGMTPPTAQAEESACVKCHREVTPNIVKDFLSGAMGKNDVDCSNCHGSNHMSADDAAYVSLPTERTCAECHEDQHEQYAAGKHALGWVAMTAMPKTGFQPHAYIQGLKGCGARINAARGQKITFEPRIVTEKQLPASYL